MKKITALTASAAVSIGMTSALTSAPCAAEDTSSPVRIMCIGDSITDGYGTAGSYRKFLCHGLAVKGFSVDMTGSKGGGWLPEYTDEVTGETFSYDDENTGYSGYAIKEYSGRNGIYETLVSTGCLSAEPDIVILQIGTNDVIDRYELDSAGERLSQLISYILGNIPSDSALFVTTIPDLEPNRKDVYDWFGNYRHTADWQTFFTDEEAAAAVNGAVEKYNSDLKNTVISMQSEHSNLYLGDVNSVITDTASQLKDGVHPNDTGFRLMGEYWTGIISEHLRPDSISEKEWRMSDAVRLSNYLLGRNSTGFTHEEYIRYDLDGDDYLSGFDLTLLRSEILEKNISAGPYTE